MPFKILQLFLSVALQMFEALPAKQNILSDKLVPMGSVQVEPIEHYKECIPLICRYLWEEWGDDYIQFRQYTTVEKLAAYYRSLESNATVPNAYVAVADGTIVGTYLIDTEDLGVHPESPDPWLANVFVFSQYRNKGYGAQLVSYAVQKYPRLNLWTFDNRLANYYGKFGFEKKEVITKHGHLENIIYMQRIYFYDQIKC